MADAAPQAPDTPLLRLDQVYLRLESALNVVAAALLFSLMLLACAEVLARKLFNSPIHGQADFVEIMIPTMGFFGLAYCQRLAGHVRMEIFLRILTGRALWIAEFIGTCTTLLITVLMIYGTWSHFLRAYTLGDTTMDVELPVWPPKLIITFGFCILLGRLLIEFFGFLRLIRYPDAEPVGVPINPTVEQIAAEEAAQAREAYDDEDLDEDGGKAR